MTRAVVAQAYGGPEVLRVVDMELGAPGPGEVLVEVRAAGVNPADWKQYSGAWGTDPAKLPMRLGFEASGVVRAVGADVEGFAPGDEVLAQPVSGAYAAAFVAPATAVLAKPASLDWAEAAGLLLAGTTAAHLLTATRVGAGDTVLVHGASGAVGAMAVQLARLRGAHVVGTASPARHDGVAHLGAHPVAYGDGLTERVREAAPSGVDAAVDTAGTDEALDTSVTLVADRSRVATVAGFEHGEHLGVQVLGGRSAEERAVRRAARTVLVDRAGRGELVVRIGARYSLSDVAEAHRAGRGGRVQGKIVLLP